MKIFPKDKKITPSYPDTKLLNRERKVIDRVQKEKIRKGTKGLKKVKTQTKGEF